MTLELIADRFIWQLAKDEGLERVDSEPGAGLLESIQYPGLTEPERERINGEVANFYEHTTDYNFEVWSDWNPFFRPFAWLLNRIFSRCLQQLNLPLNPLDTAKGLRSRVIKLRDPVSRATRYPIWYRIIKGSGDVIYSGIYTACAHPRYGHPLLKVIFPLPKGSASVVMDRSVEADGSLLQRSDGRYFGENGFYFTLTDGQGKWWAKFLRAMHEWIRVYEDGEGALRADHHLRFFGFRLMELHYRLVRFR
ncbi:hypothetical protein [Neolewinella xylanilytica]|uniref:hypothetical protein n=1 Tax=Neolewinella xylanilytica TaxID=1514080 RepID=UPI0011B08D0E|nr:hypothetical protein [Neolewinella xylanilytica]